MPHSVGEEKSCFICQKWFVICFKGPEEWNGNFVSLKAHSLHPNPFLRPDKCPLHATASSSHISKMFALAQWWHWGPPLHLVTPPRKHSIDQKEEATANRENSTSLSLADNLCYFLFLWSSPHAAPCDPKYHFHFSDSAQGGCWHTLPSPLNCVRFAPCELSLLNFLFLLSFSFSFFIFFSSCWQNLKRQHTSLIDRAPCSQQGDTAIHCLHMFMLLERKNPVFSSQADWKIFLLLRGPIYSSTPIFFSSKWEEKDK